MVQVSVQLDLGSRGRGEPLAAATAWFDAHERQTPRVQGHHWPNKETKDDFDGDFKAYLKYIEFFVHPPHWEGVIGNNKSHCLEFETSTASNGLPICVEALLFGLLSALTYPVGAGLGVLFNPVSTWTSARWMALGAGALVFSVATQIYGNALFALLAVSRKYGPFDKGCKVERGISVCDEKFWNLIVTTIAGFLGAFAYLQMNKLLHRWAKKDRSWKSCSGPFETDAAESTVADNESAINGGVTETPDPSVLDSESELSDAGGADATPKIHAVVSSNVAFSMWLGCLLDSVPSAIMLGLLTNRHQVSFGFLFALALANFPVAFSGASLLLQNDMSEMTVMLLWTSIFLITGLLALLASFFFPETCSGETFSVSALYGTSVAEGLTGGLMLAMLATAMLPAAYKGARHAAGIYFVGGFLTSILAETFNAYLQGPQQLLHNGKDHQLLWGFGR
jgi:hypothetical protein